MARIKANGTEMEISLMVFDKDGLMFKSQPFWAQIGNERIRILRNHLNEEQIAEWAAVFGLTYTDGNVTYADPKGILAVASPREEIAVTAGLIVKDLGMPWAKALEIATAVFQQADKELDLTKALVATKGFPMIFKRLRDAGIPYAIATSDTKQRVIDSLALLGEVPPEIVVVPEMVAKGKPAPDMLELAAKLCNAPISSVAMVGDSYVDVKMARDAGGLGIGVPENPEMRAAMGPYATAIVNSLDDIEIL